MTVQHEWVFQETLQNAEMKSANREFSLIEAPVIIIDVEFGKNSP